jgi:hypothetical protein
LQLLHSCFVMLSEAKHLTMLRPLPNTPDPRFFVSLRMTRIDERREKV